MAEWVRSLYFSALNHSIISPLCLVLVRAPHWPHVRQAKFCLQVCQVVFPGYSRFAPPTHWLVSISEIILKGKLNKKKKLININPGPAGPVSIRFHYACLCGRGRIDPGSPGK